MQFKEIEFKQSTNSNRDYQLKTEELKPELERKERKWEIMEDLLGMENSLDVVVGNSIFN